MGLPERSADAKSSWAELLLLTDRPEVIAVAANNLGTLMRAQGKFEEAQGLYKKALSVDPDNEIAKANLTALAHDMARHALGRGRAEAHQDLFSRGLSALEKGNNSQMLALADELIAQEPTHLGALYLRAHALMDLPGRSHESLESWQTILTRGEQAALLGVAASNIGTIYRTQRSFVLAEKYYQQSLEADPGNSVTYNNLGVLHRDTNRVTESEQAFRKALELNPGYAEAYGNLGALLSDENRHLEAIEACERGVSLNPGSLVARFNLGCALNKIGRSEQAIECYKEALKINPAHLESLTNLLFALNFVARAPPAETLQYAKWFGRVARENARPYQSWNVENPAIKLRIGLVSGDMLDHPVGFFLEQVVSELNPARFELYGYMTCDRSSALTARIRPRFAAWRMVQYATDVELGKQIWDDGIHILIDLAGHTGFNRAAMFAHRPAPVQVSWLGYFATTGVAEMDYFLADPISVPTKHEHHFTEKIWRLPETRLCFTPPHGAPAVQDTPAIRNHFVTFGCFQDLTKITEPVLAAWSTIMQTLSTARLRLQTGRFSNLAVRDAFMQRLSAAGIETARVEVYGGAPRNSYLDSYAAVDILLDTFPFPGGTTTAEALYMGVPTVTIMGDRLIARQGAGMLLSVGLDDWIARDPGEYITLALQKGADIESLQALRMSLRARTLISPLFDGRRFATHFEAAMEGMWQAWLDTSYAAHDSCLVVE
jgi:predicted O-linked N-acetylglucosamine transferase (SPINDLY family)